MYASPMARPAPYSGSAEDCSGFLLQCELVLEMQPHLYPSDTSKIAFLISQLSGKALKWADSIWSQHGAVTQSYSAFISHFREVFGKPITDSSAGEKLYNLKQGSMSIYDYALQFRTLAAVCGWNEQALITTYRQGLEPRVRLHLAACEDSIKKKFIQHSIRCATHMQACLQEHQDQLLSISPLCRSEPVSSPEPANEPMDVENSRLTPSERQRRLTLNLCLYCGTPGHAIAACPIRPPRPMVSAIIPSIKKMKPLTTVVNLTAADVSLTVVALLDSGSAGNFISGALCRQLRLKTSPSPTVYQINSITGRPLSRKHVRRTRSWDHHSRWRCSENTIASQPFGRSAIEGSEGGDSTRTVSGNCLIHLREERNRWRALAISVCSPQGPIVQPGAFGTGWRVPFEPDALSCPGKHGRQLGIRLGQRWRPRGRQRSRILIS
ncbi:Retrotransposon-derived protein PEG10 [Anabarilius grahami]|uniref:Retrotransposon-derived protein PEG10 n=1 Tax=Anabarilius grahami TaxID=495550 RepID=A0A3N0XPN8_ANAGA|nr:Retrotransposon-derived protein PEG10 [Anabarilius grahami]